MNFQTSNRALSTGLSVLLLLCLTGELFAQSRNRFTRPRDNDSRTTTPTPAPAVREPAPDTTPAATPVATPIAEPVAMERPMAEPIITQTSTPKPATSSPSIPDLGDLDSITSKLPKEVQTVISDTRVQEAVGMVTEKVKEGDTDALLKTAQEKANEQGGLPSMSEAREKASTILGNAPTAEPMEATAEPTPTATPATAPEETPALAATSGDVPAPRPMQPRYQRDTADAPVAGAAAEGSEEDGEVMKIRSNESEMREKEGLIIFRGDVFVVEPKFTLYGDELTVYQFKEGESPDNDAGAIKTAIATGRIVEIKRMGTDGQAQVAQARRAVYNAVTGTVVLSGGPPVLQSGAQMVKTSSQDATITLTPDGNHSVKDSLGNQIIIPMGKKDGINTGPNIPGAGGLESLRGGN